MDIALTITAGLVFGLLLLIGVALTALTLPGLWLPVLAACIWEFFFPGSFSWWTIGAAALLGVIAEAIEFFGAAAGTKRSGGTRSGALGATIGSIIGAIAGSMVLPIIGTIAGAVIGAGAGAITGERGIAGKTWQASMKSGAGAARGRAVALIVKTSVAAVIGLVLAVAAVVD